MALHTTVNCPNADWTQLTTADVTALTFQIVKGGPTWITVTTDTTKPTIPSDGSSPLGANLYTALDGEKTVTLATMWPGIAGKRVWAMPNNATRSEVMVSHA